MYDFAALVGAFPQVLMTPLLQQLLVTGNNISHNTSGELLPAGFYFDRYTIYKCLAWLGLPNRWSQKRDYCLWSSSAACKLLRAIYSLPHLAWYADWNKQLSALFELAEYLYILRLQQQAAPPLECLLSLVCSTSLTRSKDVPHLYCPDIISRELPLACLSAA